MSSTVVGGGWTGELKVVCLTSRLTVPIPDYQWLPPNTVIYTSTVDFAGADSFTFRSHDGQDFSNISTITLTVAAANDAPLALAQTISTNVSASSRRAVQAAGAATTFTTQTDAIGTWRLDGVPLGQYTLRIDSSAAIQIEAPLQTQLTVGQRGVQQLQPTGVTIPGRAIFLPLIQR